MFKHTLLINYTSGQGGNAIFKTNRGSGFSESYISSTDQSIGALSNWSKLLTARSNLLPKTVSIVGYRVADLTHASATKATHKVIAGTLDDAQAEPSLALQAGGLSSLGNRLRLVLRALPDTFGTAGDLDLTPEFQKAFKAFKATLATFGQLVTDLSAPTVDIVDISSLGVVRTMAALAGVAVNRSVNVLRTNLNGKRKGGKFRVTARVDDSNFTLANWIGDATEGGRIRLIPAGIGKVLTMYQPDNIEPEDLVNRKTGKSFFSYRGRR